MRCPVCHRSLEETRDAEIRCFRCEATVRPGETEAAIVSLGRPPPGLEIERGPAGGRSYREASVAAPFVVAKRWRSTGVLMPLFQSLFLLGAMVWVLQQNGRGPMQTFLTVGAAVLGALACFAGWYVLAFTLNRSRLHVSREEVRLTTGPIPWPWRRGHTVVATTIRGVRAHAVQREVKDKPRHLQGTEGTLMVTRWWNVIARTAGGDAPLLRRLSREEAHYLAERIRRTLALRS